MYGLENAPPFFQRIMDRTVRGVVYARCCIDDIIMWSENVELHIGHVGAVLKLLDSKGLGVHLGKCVFGADNIDFLGHRTFCQLSAAPRREAGSCSGPASIHRPPQLACSPRTLILLPEVRAALQFHCPPPQPTIEEGCSEAFQELKLHLCQSPVL